MSKGSNRPAGAARTDAPEPAATSPLGGLTMLILLGEIAHRLVTFGPIGADGVRPIPASPAGHRPR